MATKKPRAKGVKDKPLKLTRSYELFTRAEKVLPGGVSSNARLWATAQFCPLYTPCTIFIERASEGHVWDVDKNEYIDYRLGFGPVILGHGYPPVEEAIRKASLNGSVYGLDNELEVEVAEQIVSAVPCAELVRFSVTGTEATMHTIRVARAYTKRDIIIKFTGHYHGSHDYLLYSAQHTPFEYVGKGYPMSKGIPKAINKLVISVRWNDPVRITEVMKAYKGKIAAIITEPIMGNAAAIMPQPGYLGLLKELCDQYDSLLIFDEVKTGFRTALGGAQELYNVTPHLATFAKSVSNGYPLSVITGQREIMELYGPGKVAQGGTYAGNPISLAAAKSTLEVLNKPGTYAKLNSYGRKLMRGISKVFSENSVGASINGVPTMFQYALFKGMPQQLTHYYDLKESDTALFTKLQYELMKQGVLVDEDYEECIFTCLAHNNADLEKTLEAFAIAVPAAKTSTIKPTGRFSVKEEKTTVGI